MCRSDLVYEREVVFVNFRDTVEADGAMGQVRNLEIQQITSE
jgi:hypothetical protein